jgi:N-acetylglucosamine kinase-like BadF-type ATPase
MKKYLLGVDGGNSKTDYLLCTVEGGFVDVLRTGTCSHEQFADGFDGMERVMEEQVSQLLGRNGIAVADIVSAGFGLAGADLPGQVVELRKRVEAIGFKRFAVANDGILGVKGASDSGVGVTAVNGTGTVVVGIDEKGEVCQVGGVGPLSGDYAGGSYIVGQIISSLYSFYNRCGADSAMFQPVMSHLGVDPADLLTVVSDPRPLYQHSKVLIQIGAKAASEGDVTAKAIFDNIGVSIGQSAAGCIRNLSFENFGTAESPIDIVPIGSLWHKVPYEGMASAFLRTVEALSGKKCRVVNMKAPPAAGGVLWAKEIADEKPVSVGFRKGLLESISMEKYEAHTQ